MNITRRQDLIAAALACALVTTVALAQPAAQEKAAPVAVEQSAYATAVEAYIRFLPRYYSYSTEKLVTGVPEPLSRPAAPLNQVGYRRSLVTPDFLFIVRPNNNWLPSPAGELNLMCRAYGPQQALLDGKYTMPPVKRGE